MFVLIFFTLTAMFFLGIRQLIGLFYPLGSYWDSELLMVDVILILIAAFWADSMIYDFSKTYKAKKIGNKLKRRDADAEKALLTAITEGRKPDEPTIATHINGIAHIRKDGVVYLRLMPNEISFTEVEQPNESTDPKTASLPYSRITNVGIEVGSDVYFVIEYCGENDEHKKLVFNAHDLRKSSVFVNVLKTLISAAKSEKHINL